MTNVRTIVNAALTALPKALEGREPTGVRVEEVEPPDADSYWRVTLSYLEDGVRMLRTIPVDASEG